MSAAMGIGCRAGVDADTVLRAIEATLARAPSPVSLAGLHTSVRKLDEPGLRDAGARLGLALRYHEDEALRAQRDRLASPSATVARLVGLDSVAEAAALAGAGEGARLIVPKHTLGGVACAIAAAKETAE